MDKIYLLRKWDAGRKMDGEREIIEGNVNARNLALLAGLPHENKRRRRKRGGMRGNRVPFADGGY